MRRSRHQARKSAAAATSGATIGDRMATDIRAIVEELGGAPIFGRPIRTPGDLRTAIREGFPRTVIDEVMQAGDHRTRHQGVAMILASRR